MNDSLFTFEALVTLGGAAYMTFLIVAYTKEIVQRLTKIPTDLYAVFTGSVVLLLAQFGMGQSVKDWRVWILSILNGFLIAANAGKSNDITFKPPGFEPEWPVLNEDEE